MAKRHIISAPRDGTPILLETSDFGWVQGYWDANVTNFYKSQEGWDSYDPDNAQGDWVSDRTLPTGKGESDNGERRLYCGLTPHYWLPLPADSLNEKRRKAGDSFYLIDEIKDYNAAEQRELKRMAKEGVPA